MFTLKAPTAKAMFGKLNTVAEAGNRAVYRGINKVASKTLTRSRREITSQVNLTASYVRERMDLKEATPRQLKAVISARIRATRLATYGANQLTKSAKRAKGDARRGISGGRKQAGVSVKVKKSGARKKMRKAFFMPLKNGNGMGVFIRTGSGRGDIKHLYGPSVDQVFKGVIKDIEQDVEADLKATISAQLEYELKGVMK